MKTIIPKIKYRLYGSTKHVEDNILDANDSYYPIPATPEFDSYLEAKTFYTDAVEPNKEFYKIKDGDSGYFETVVIVKTDLMLPYKTSDEDQPGYSNEPFEYDNTDPNEGVAKL